jgi:hypothetical protein
MSEEKMNIILFLEILHDMIEDETGGDMFYDEG